ncbi:MAG: hypothetical protein Q9162_006629 [Coniocarpon cinnabarinum]
MPIGLGMAEFSDQPMPRPPERGITSDEFMEAKYVTEYLEEYMKDHTYDGKTMLDRLWLNFKVDSAEKRAGKWKVFGTHRSQQHTLSSSKLVVATGLTSVPQMPTLPGREIYQGVVVHQEAFGSSQVLASEEVQSVTVIGGAKSAADMVYAAIKAGKQVNWLIRRSGSGPAAFVSGKGSGKYNNSAELGATRFLGSMSPSIFLPNTWWTWFVQRTWLGMWAASKVWSIATAKSRAVFADDKDREKGFELLKPSVNVSWANDTLGLILLEDFWSEVEKNVQVYCGDIEQLDEHAIKLQDGTSIPSDAILCGTGWMKAHFVFDHEEAIRLGLPHDPSAEAEPHWRLLEARQDEKVMQEFPMLRSPPIPAFQKPKRTLTPYRLYNLIAPIEERDDHSIAFVGCIQVPNAFRPAEIQALWATAFLDGHVSLPPKDEAEEKVARMVAWNRRRYLNNGASGIYLHYDVVGYTDMLLRDLELAQYENRPQNWLADLMDPAYPRGLRPVREAFMAKYNQEGSNSALKDK